MIEDRKIIIFKKEVFEQIDHITQKFADAALSEMVAIARDALTSDNDEALDSLVLSRYVDYRAARVRKLLSPALNRSPLTHYDNEGYPIEARAGKDASDEMPVDPKYVYEIKDNVRISGDILESLAIYIHEYIVRGALYDWYSHLGSDHARDFGDIFELEKELQGIMDCGIVWRQPGPFVKNYRTR